MIDDDNNNRFYPVVTGSNGDIRISYRSGRREVMAEGEDVSVPVEARPVWIRNVLTGYDIFLREKHVSFVTENDISKVAVNSLDYYVRRFLDEEVQSSV